MLTTTLELSPDLTVESSPATVLDRPLGEVAIGQDQLIDPTVTLLKVETLLTKLPEVKILERPVLQSSSSAFEIEDDKGNEIGFAVVVSSKELKSEYFGDVVVFEKGKGYGSAVYLTAIQQALSKGYDFRTDPSEQSSDAVKIWQRLRDEELATVVDKFSPVEGREGLFRGYYVVNGNNQPKTRPVILPPVTVEL